MNTKQTGILRFAIFKEKFDYVGVCLDLNIIEYGKDPEELMKSVREAAFSYLETVRSEKLSDDMLNQPAPEKYWKKLQKIQSESLKKSSLTRVNPEIYFSSTILQPYNHQNCINGKC